GPEGAAFATLARLPALAALAPADLRRALGIMVATRLIEVQPGPGKPASPGGSPAIPAALNRLMLKELPGAGSLVYLASPASGTAHPVNHVDGAILLDLVQHGREGLPARILAWMSATGRHVTNKGERVPDADVIPV